MSVDGLKRILIVDDHELIRAGVRRLLSETRYIVCGEAANGMEALDQVPRTKPDLVILDVTMPRMSGVEAALQIRVLWPSVKILLFSMHRPELLMSVPFDGIVCKTDAALKLLEVIDTLLSESETDHPNDTAVKRSTFKAKSDKRPKAHTP